MAAERALSTLQPADVMTPREVGAIVPMGRASAVDYLVEFEAAIKIGEWIFQSGLAPTGVKNGAAVAVLILTGHEYGWSWMQSMRNFHVISGKACLTSDAMAGLINDHCRKVGGGYLKVVDQTPESATVEYKRHDRPDIAFASFTIEDARRAGIYERNPVWKTYPQDMCKARALVRACRTGWPEICGGMYDPDEISSTQPHGGYIEVQRPTAVARAVEAKLAAEPTIIDAESAPAISTPKQDDNAIIDASVVDKITEAATAAKVSEIDLNRMVRAQYGAATLQALRYGQARTLFKTLQKPVGELAVIIEMARDWAMANTPQDVPASTGDQELSAEDADFLARNYPEADS